MLSLKNDRLISPHFPDGVNIYAYRIPIRSPVLPFSVRKGLIVETAHGWGEASPLPGFSHETLFEAFESFRTQDLTASAAFALRCAAQPFPVSFPSIVVSALVTSLTEAVRAVEDGFRTLKIKVKDYRVEDALRLIGCLQKLPVRLRIDANRRWNLSEALHFFRSLDPAQIEYIEEPVQNPADLASLPPLPVALDETLLENNCERFLSLPHLQALILKPTLLGSGLDRLIGFAKTHHKKIVFSSSFESAVGLLHIAHLQSRHDPETAAGVDTHRSFMQNFLPIKIENGRLQPNLLPPLDRTWLDDPVF